jgi:plasmid stabilization system protein ParE
MHLVHVADAAEKDLLGILDYIGINSAAMAEHVEAQLSGAIDSLEEFPERGAIASESEKWGYTVRMLIVFSFRILYTVRKDDVVVLRIVHGSQMTPVPPTK